jgi:hypothetical protein
MRLTGWTRGEPPGWHWWCCCCSRHRPGGRWPTSRKPGHQVFGRGRGDAWAGSLDPPGGAAPSPGRAGSVLNGAGRLCLRTSCPATPAQTVDNGDHYASCQRLQTHQPASRRTRPRAGSGFSPATVERRRRPWRGARDRGEAPAVSLPSCSTPSFAASNQAAPCLRRARVSVSGATSCRPGSALEYHDRRAKMPSPCRRH